MGKKQRKRKEKKYVNAPSAYIVPPPNPKGFGTVPEHEYEQSAVITGRIYFDDPFYNVLPPPPLGSLDPCYDEWLAVVKGAEDRYTACAGDERSIACELSREEYFEAARGYAYALDRHWGLNRYADEAAQAAKDAKKRKKNRT